MCLFSHSYNIYKKNKVANKKCMQKIVLNKSTSVIFFLAEKCVSTGVGSELLVQPCSWGHILALGVWWRLWRRRRRWRGEGNGGPRHTTASVAQPSSGAQTQRSCVVQYMWYVYFGNSKNNSQYNKNNLHPKYIIFFLYGKYINNNNHHFHYLQEILMYMSFCFLCVLLKSPGSGSENPGQWFKDQWKAL